MKKNEVAIQLSENLSIRIVVQDDINQDYLETLIDQQSLRYMGDSRSESYGCQSLKRYIAGQYNSKNNYLFGLYKDKYLIATSRVHDIKSNGCWQGILVFKKFQNQKNGYILVKNVSDYVLKSLDVKNVYAGILQENLFSQKLFEKCGFAYLMDDSEYIGRKILVKKSV